MSPPKAPKGKADKSSLIYIERFFVDPKECASWVLMYDPKDNSFRTLQMSRFNIQYHTFDKPTAFYFDVKENEKMWLCLDNKESILLLEVHLRKISDIEFYQKK